jgi:hypothetical protein
MGRACGGEGRADAQRVRGRQGQLGAQPCRSLGGSAIERDLRQVREVVQEQPQPGHGGGIVLTVQADAKLRCPERRNHSLDRPLLGQGEDLGHQWIVGKPAENAMRCCAVFDRVMRDVTGHMG